MYLTALEKQLIPDAETIYLNDLPDQGRWPSLNKLNNSLCEANKPTNRPTRRTHLKNRHLFCSCNNIHLK